MYKPVTAIFRTCMPKVYAILLIYFLSGGVAFQGAAQELWPMESFGPVEVKSVSIHGTKMFSLWSPAATG
jgi:hypothetical protein